LREQERLAVRLGDSATILPANQRVHFGVFVDRLVDDDEQSGPRKRKHVFVQVRVATGMLGRPLAVAAQARSVARCAALSSIGATPGNFTLERGGDRGGRGQCLRIAIDEPSHLQPSGRPSSCRTGSEIAGMPSNDACAVQEGSPVE